MIQNTELRRGNKVLNLDNVIDTVIELRDEYYLNEAGHGSLYKTSTGIPLSPEILEKCGFVLNRNNELSIEINDIASHLELMRGVDGFYYPSFTQTPQGDEERTVYFNRINSLHQIQNLYFSLCGEELTYKQ